MTATFNLSPTTQAVVLTYTGATSARPGGRVALSATLKTTGGTGISGRSVSFTLAGTTYTATTSGTGKASVSTKAPTITGSYPITVTFAGDATYQAATKSATLLVN